MFEPSDARRFLPCFDEPIFKAIYDVTVIAPANRVVVSNMPQASTQAVAADRMTTSDATYRIRLLPQV